jgi:trk system potassium uptake protein TrkA
MREDPMNILIVGAGKLAYHVARQSLARHHHVSMIVRDHDEALALAQKLNVVVAVGDGTSPEVLAESINDRIDTLLALQQADHDNLITCQIARDILGVSRTIALVNAPENVQLFHQLGVQDAISTADILGSLLQQASNFDQISASLPLAEGRIHVTEIRLNTRSPAAGALLRDLTLPDGALIAAILRGGEVLIPRGSAQLSDGDELLLVSRADVQHTALDILLGAHK